MTDPQKSSEALPHSDSPSSAAAISSSYSQSKMVKWLKNNVPTLLKNNVPTLLKIYPTRSILGGIMTLLLGGGVSNEGLRTNAWRMVGGTLDSSPLGGHRVYYDFTKKSVTSEFVLSKKMRDNIFNSPIKQIKIDIAFDPEQKSAQLYVKDMNGNFDQIELTRKRGKLLNANEKDKFSFTIDDEEIKSAQRNLLWVIDIDAVNLGNRKGSFIVENISMR
jgi:hypothetical protein